jgi:hypothetical protein
MKKKTNVTRKQKIVLSELGKSNRKFTGLEDHHISLKEAAVMTKAYREIHPGQTIAHFFGKKAIIDILSQGSCVGIRIYYAKDPSTGQKHLVIVGADADQNDISSGFIAERAICCPTNCGKPNLLNT